MDRRTFVAATALAILGAAPALVAAARVQAAEPLKEFRIGFQKTGLLVVARQQKLIETRLAAKGIAVKWVEFTSGPPLLEAMNVGALDFGYTGDAPPIFAQSAGANILYVAATPAAGPGEAIIVKEGSPITRVADLKGKRLGVTKGSSSHNLAVAALEKAGVSFADITPVYLSPADAAAAFSSDSIDAWTIWDPFFALAQSRGPVRVLTTSAETFSVNSYLLANRSFAGAQPQVLLEVIDALKDAAAWADANRPTLAQSLAEVTGVPLAAQTAATARARFGVFPLTDSILNEQQATADRFFKLGLIPKQITVRDIVWTAPKA